MPVRNRNAKINVKVLILLIVVVVGLGISLVAARQIRRSILAEKDLKAGTAAFEKGDWPVAARHFQEYLGRRPSDLEVLKKYAQARMSLRPIEPGNLSQAIASYRRVIQLDPSEADAYEKLVNLYTAVGNSEEITYLARRRLESEPNDPKASLWLAEALIRLDKKAEARDVLRRFTEHLEGRPEKPVEYANACALMGGLVLMGNDPSTLATALEWLDKGVAGVPDAAGAYVQRARFYRIAAGVSGLSREDRLRRAREDLAAADRLDNADPLVRLRLCEEWLGLDDLDQAAAQLKAMESFTEDQLQEYFVDAGNWTVARFSLASRLARRRGAIAEVVALADEVLASLAQKAHRVRVLPTIIPTYVSAGRISQARQCLDEYLSAIHAQQARAESPLQVAWLQALVAMAEGEPYAAIDLLQPFAAGGSHDADMGRLWRLLADAYTQTGQSGRAMSALLECRKCQGNESDPQVLAALARQYARMGDWQKAHDTARTAESAGVTDLGLKLLRLRTQVSLSIGPDGRADMAGLKAAAAELTTLREANPDDVGVRVIQAAIAGILGQPEELERELKLAIQECKEPLRAEVQLAAHHLATKRVPEAIAACEAACQRHSEVAEPWLFLSAIHEANADSDSARHVLTNGLNAVAEPQEKRVLSIRLARLELQHGNDAERKTAIDRLKELVRDANDVAACQILLATREIQDDPAATKELVDRLKAAEGQSGLWWRLHEARLWLRSSEWVSMQANITNHLQYCIDADPTWSAPVLLQAGMYDRLGVPARAEDTYRQAFERNPAAADVAERLLVLLQRQGRAREADEILKQIERPNLQAKRSLSIRAAVGLDDLSRAIDELKAWVAGDPGRTDLRVALGRLIYRQTGDASQALAVLKEAEAVDPNSWRLVMAQASILRSDGQEEQALQLVGNYATDRNDFYSHLLYGMFLAEKGDLEGAEREYKMLTTFEAKASVGYEWLSSFYADTKRLDLGVAAAEEGVNAYPGNAALKRRLMRLLLLRAGEQDRARALEILDELQERQPQDVELMVTRARQLLQDGTPSSRASAREELERAIRIEPTAVNAHLLLVAMAVQEQDYRAVRECAIRGLGSNANHSALLAARARAELELGDPRTALSLARLALQGDPNDTDAMHVLLSVDLSSQDAGLRAEVRKWTDEAVTRNPANERMQLFRAQTLNTVGLSKEAIPELETYCGTEPGSTSLPALLMLADSYRLAGDAERANEWIERAEQLAPGSQKVAHARFLWLMSQKRLGDLAETSAEFIAAKDQDLTTILRAASLLLSLDAPELKREALRLFEHAVTVAPKWKEKEAQVSLALAQYQAGNAEVAEKMYRGLLEQYPNDARVLNDLAWLLQEHYQRYAEALELADRGLRSMPDEVHLLDTRATILLQLPDRRADAKRDFEAIVGLSGNDARRQAKSLLQLGRICVKLNELSEAKRHFQKAWELDQRIGLFTPEERAEIKGMVE